MNLPIRHSRIKLSQGQIFWYEVGQGTALIFLHGTTVDSSQWLPLLQKLGTQFQCFAPDLLGFGDSDRPKVHYSIHLEMECLAEFIEALNLKSVYLIGHSLGAWVACHYALKYPEKVSGMVLISPVGAKLEGLKKPLEKIKQPNFLQRWIYSLLRSLYPSTQRFAWHKRLGQFLRHQSQLQQNPVSPVATKLLAQRRRSEIEAELLQGQLSRLDLPVLLIQPEGDLASQSESFALEFPNHKLHILPASDEELGAENWAAIAPLIHQFIS